MEIAIIGWILLIVGVLGLIAFANYAIWIISKGLLGKGLILRYFPAIIIVAAFIIVGYVIILQSRYHHYEEVKIEPPSVMNIVYTNDPALIIRERINSLTTSHKGFTANITSSNIPKDINIAKSMYVKAKSLYASAIKNLKLPNAHKDLSQAFIMLTALHQSEFSSIDSEGLYSKVKALVFSPEERQHRLEMYLKARELKDKALVMVEQENWDEAKRLLKEAKKILKDLVPFEDEFSDHIPPSVVMYQIKTIEQRIDEAIAIKDVTSSTEPQ